MLNLRVIKGPGMGQTFELKSGSSIIGRSAECDIVLSSSGVSKRHAKITFQGHQLLISDLKSSNGTYVNGRRINDHVLQPGDRIGFHDVIMEIAVQTQMQSLPMAVGSSFGQHSLAASGAAQWEMENQINAGLQMAPHAVVEDPKSFIGFVKKYVETVVLPGVYHLTEIYPLKNVIAVLIAAFAVAVTALSTIPMAELTREGVQKEAQRRALTIARQLANVAEHAISTGTEASVRTDFAENEDGVTTALVVSKDDGHIIAPIAKADTYSNNQFVASASKFENEPYHVVISGSTVSVSVPVRVFVSEVGQQVVTAYAIIIYKMEALDWGITVGLFARVLIMALLLGFVVYFFIYKLMTHPIIDANMQMDKALRGDLDQITTKTDFDIFKKLLENITSAVGRMGSLDSQKAHLTLDRHAEASNVVRIVSDPAFVLDDEMRFLQVNSAFEDLTGMRLLTLQGQDLSMLQDQALKLNLEDLVSRAKIQPAMIISGELDISGETFEIDLIGSPKEKDPTQIHYFLGTLKKRGGA